MRKHILTIIAIGLIFGAMIASVQTVYAASEPEGCIAFTSAKEFTVSLGNSETGNTWDGVVQVSTNGSDWEDYMAGASVDAVKAPNGEYSVFFRGESNSHICYYYYDNNTHFQLTGEEISCSGNIENLLDHTEVEENKHPEMSDNAFYWLFKDCASLTEAPELPATTLADFCYAYMFSGCTSLTEAPVLPATTLAYFCYANMFSGCTSLTEAPVLPATTLAYACYSSMFFGCTSLTKAPELPATTLTQSCYGSMFYDCTSLTEAPELPATTLAKSCYSYMFYGCESLTRAPVLSATTLAEYCYYAMFSGCISLTVPPKLPATTLPDYCYQYMFLNSGVKLSEEKGIFDGVFYGIPYRIPEKDTGTAGSLSLSEMFYDTHGRFTETPDLNTTYYLSCWSGRGTEDDPFVISDTYDWNVLSDLVKDGYTMEGLFFRLGDNIEVTRMVGESGKPFSGSFSGSFDGAQYTLTFNPETAPEYCAPFAYTQNASFKDLHVAGTIKTDHKYAAGLIGRADGRNKVTNCRSSVTIDSGVNGDGTHGGFIAKGGADFEGCVFDGELLGPETTLCGGFLGWANPTGYCSFKSCLFAPQKLTLKEELEVLSRNVTAATPVENSYYTKNIDYVQGKAVRVVTADEGITVGSANMTEYSVSGITAYDTGLAYGNAFYAGKDDVIPVTIPYTCDKLSANVDTLTGAGTSYTLTMPDQDVHLTLAKGANHKWKFTGFTWTGDEKNGYTAAVANYECENDPVHKDTVTKVTLDQKVTEPTCLTGGKTAFTAAVTAADSLDGKDHSESRDAVATEATGHQWKFTGFKWTGDEEKGYTAAIANYECENDPVHKDTVTKVTLDQKVTEPTCLTGGKTAFTAAVTAADSLDGKDHSESRDAVATEAAGHQWKEATCTEPKTCTVCHVTEGEAAGHAWGVWTALNENQHQRVCGNDSTHTETADHAWDEGVVTKEPTAEENGEKTFTCSICSATKAEVIPKQEVIPPDDTPVDPEIPVIDAARISTVGNFARKEMKIVFQADAGVTNYRIQYRMAGETDWKDGWIAGTDAYLIRNLDKASLCEFRICGFVKLADGSWVRSEWSDIAYRYIQAVKVKSAKAGKGRLKVTWKKDKKATGYQIKYFTDKKIHMADADTIFVKGKAKTKYTIKKLPKGIYYVKVRPVKVVDGKEYLGILKNTRKAKVK